MHLGGLFLLHASLAQGVCTDLGGLLLLYASVAQGVGAALRLLGGGALPRVGAAPVRGRPTRVVVVVRRVRQDTALRPVTAAEQR